MEKIKKIMQRIGLALKGFAQRIAIEAKQTVLDLKEGKNLKKHLYRFLILVFDLFYLYGKPVGSCLVPVSGSSPVMFLGPFSSIVLGTWWTL